MKTHTTTTPQETSANTQRSDGWMRRFVRLLDLLKREKSLTLRIPENIMNLGVANGKITGDSNNSADWHELAVPLPSGKWTIRSRKGDQVKLTRRYLFA